MRCLLTPLLLIIASAASAAPCPRCTMTGPVTHVRDGDTILVGTMPIRLNGLAAPEWDEPGGAAAAQAMIGLVYGRTLRCELNGERTHDRCVGVCYVEGVDIAAHLVAAGLARDCPRFSGGRYAFLEGSSGCCRRDDRTELPAAWVLPLEDGATENRRRATPVPAYDAEQLEAEQAQRGLWSGPFVPPWEWRAR